VEGLKLIQASCFKDLRKLCAINPEKSPVVAPHTAARQLAPFKKIQEETDPL
jgi:hypothetical protein